MPLFRAYDRGIAVASLYAATLIVCAELFLLTQAPFEMHAALWAACGFIAGAIGGFSNTESSDSFRRDVARNACDAVMISVWTAVFILGINLLSMLAVPLRLAQLLGVFAIAVLGGAVAGEPILVFIGSLSVKGRRPFAAANHLTTSLQNPHARFVAKVVLQTIVFGGLVLLAAAVAFAVMMIVAFIIVIAMFLFMLKAMLSSGERSSSVSSLGRRAIRLGRGQKVDDDGRVVEEGLFFDRPTGQRINRDGQIVDEGLFFDRPTGIKIAHDGRVQKEGTFFDQDTGVRLVDDGHGGSRVVEEGLLFDRDTGYRIDANGRPMKEGLLFDHEEGFEIDEDGNVRKS